MVSSGAASEKDAVVDEANVGGLQCLDGIHGDNWTPRGVRYQITRMPSWPGFKAIMGERSVILECKILECKILECKNRSKSPRVQNQSLGANQSSSVNPFPKTRTPHGAFNSHLHQIGC
jgi:hypothetical protein